MSYSIDLRERVVEYVNSGGSKTAASRNFKVSLWCVKDWCKRDDLSPKSPPGRPRKMNWEALEKDIKINPDRLLRERAQEFSVWPNAIWYACRIMKITYKKNFSLSRKRP